MQDDKLELIDRAAVVRELDEDFFYETLSTGDHEKLKNFFDVIMKSVKEIEAADLNIRCHTSKWHDQHGRHARRTYICMMCGGESPEDTAYCPHCGSHMMNASQEARPLIEELEETMVLTGSPEPEAPVPVLESEEPVREPVHITIQLQSSPAAEPKTFTIESFPCIIGRKAEMCNLVIPEAYISRKHACLKIAEDKLLVEDISQHNGIRVDGKKIPKEEAVQIHEGSVLTLGKAEMKILSIC